MGKTDCANQPATKKMPPPINSVSMIARGMVLRSFASSVYIVMASKPMKEKHTTVAPVSTAAGCTPSWKSGSVLKMVLWPIPLDSWMAARTMNPRIRTISKTTSIELSLDVEVIDQRFNPVIKTT